ncbi:MAG TPA: GH25 family lysozyme [Candidatus Saccharimonadales bacterium]|nr:GH25 family lysozyme [Candidatus Saccharimonadales bacterium]
MKKPKRSRSNIPRKNNFRIYVAAILGVAVAVAGLIFFLSDASPSAIIGADIYNGQPVINGAQAKQQGAQFIISKASQGTGFTDIHFAANRATTVNNGMIAGAYHFLEAGNPDQQAQFFVNTVQQNGGLDNIMLMVDAETYQSCSGGPCVTKYPSYADITEFVSKVQQLVPGRQIILYTGAWFWGSSGQSGYLGNPAAPPGTVLDFQYYVSGTGSLASLLNNVSPPGSADEPYAAHPINGWPTYFFRQFTSSGTLANESPVDGDVTYQPLSALQALAGMSSDTTPPTVSISAPSASSIIKGTTTVTATAADNDSIARVDFKIDGKLLASDITAPYTAAWDSSTTACGNHAITATAYDNANNSSAATPVAVTVYKLADLNNDCKVSIYDLSSLLTYFGKTGPGLTGDINNDGKVTVTDLSIMLTEWTG